MSYETRQNTDADYWKNIRFNNLSLLTRTSASELTRVVVVGGGGVKKRWRAE